MQLTPTKAKEYKGASYSTAVLLRLSEHNDHPFALPGLHRGEVLKVGTSERGGTKILDSLRDAVLAWTLRLPYTRPLGVSYRKDEMFIDLCSAYETRNYPALGMHDTQLDTSLKVSDANM